MQLFFHFSNMDKTEAGAQLEKDWEAALAKYTEKYPEEGAVHLPATPEEQP